MTDKNRIKLRDALRARVDERGGRFVLADKLGVHHVSVYRAITCRRPSGPVWEAVLEALDLPTTCDACGGAMTADALARHLRGCLTDEGAP